MLLGENVNNYKFPSYRPRKTASFYTFALVHYNYNHYSGMLLEKLLLFLKCLVSLMTRKLIRVLLFSLFIYCPITSQNLI